MVDFTSGPCNLQSRFHSQHVLAMTLLTPEYPNSLLERETVAWHLEDDEMRVFFEMYAVPTREENISKYIFESMKVRFSRIIYIQILI